MRELVLARIVERGAVRGRELRWIDRLWNLCVERETLEIWDGFTTCGLPVNELVPPLKVPSPS
jgi:hypothetical protein